MKKFKLIFSVIAVMLTGLPGISQTTVITDDGSYVSGEASAVVDIKSIERGLLIPRLTIEQRDGIDLPATGLFIFQTDGVPGFYYNSGTPVSPAWTAIREGLISGTAFGDILYWNGSNWAILPLGDDGQMLMVMQGLLSWGNCVMACPEGYTTCNGICVNFEIDRYNCNGCGINCPPGFICSNGQCVLSCQVGLVNCAGVCVNTNTDRNNCGGCGIVCPPGYICNGGVCQLSCQSGYTICSGNCVNTQNDRNHCGACGNVCPAGYICSAGNCILSCQAGLINCGGICVNTNTDPDHCGNCTTVCPNGYECQGGTCVPICP